MKSLDRKILHDSDMRHVAADRERLGLNSVLDRVWRLRNEYLSTYIGPEPAFLVISEHDWRRLRYELAVVENNYLVMDPKLDHYELWGMRVCVSRDSPLIIGWGLIDDTGGQL